jgi:hypothetical protein
MRLPRHCRIALRAAAALVAVTWTALPRAAGAQQPRQGSEQEVMRVITGLFDAMRARDTAKMRAAFDPDVKFTSVTMGRDSTSIRNEELDEFLRAVGTPRPDTLDERLRSPVVHVDGDLATVWTEYDFFVGTRFSHCGADAFQLVRRKEGWRIVALADTRRRTGCPTSQ